MTMQSCRQFQNQPFQNNPFLSSKKPNYHRSVLLATRDVPVKRPAAAAAVHGGAILADVAAVATAAATSYSAGRVCGTQGLGDDAITATAVVPSC